MLPVVYFLPSSSPYWSFPAARRWIEIRRRRTGDILRIRPSPAWTLEEDMRLERFVREKGRSRVACDTMMRSPRQCGDRWREHLACNLYHRPFTVQGAAAPRSVPRHARQGLVALVPDERQGTRLETREAMLFHKSLFISNQTVFGIWGRDFSRVIPMPTKHKIWCS